MYSSGLLTIALQAILVGHVMGHGKVLDPKPRVAGQAFKAACGEQAFNNVNSDPDGNIQQLMQLIAGQKNVDASKCNLALCKGIPQADGSCPNVQTYSAGQVVPMQVEIKAPHTGVANVSVVDTASNSIIGSPMIDFPVYASTSSGVKKNETSFSVTIPDLAGKCGQCGQCVIQWWWDAPAPVNQTYMSCIDFVQGASSGSGSSTSSGGTSSTSTSSSSSSSGSSSSSSTTSGSSTSSITSTGTTTNKGPNSTSTGSSSGTTTKSSATSTATNTSGGSTTRGSSSYMVLPLSWMSTMIIGWSIFALLFN